MLFPITAKVQCCERLRKGLVPGSFRSACLYLSGDADMRDAHAGVRFTKAFAREMTANPDADTVGRTIGHDAYDIDARTIDVSFYLGDNEDGTDRRSEYQTFELKAYEHEPRSGCYRCADRGRHQPST